MTSLSISLYLVVLPLTSAGNQHHQIGECPATVLMYLKPYLDMQVLYYKGWGFARPHTFYLERVISSITHTCAHDNSIIMVRQYGSYDHLLPVPGF